MTFFVFLNYDFIDYLNKKHFFFKEADSNFLILDLNFIS